MKAWLPFSYKFPVALEEENIRLISVIYNSVQSPLLDYFPLRMLNEIKNKNLTAKRERLFLGRGNTMSKKLNNLPILAIYQICLGLGK